MVAYAMKGSEGMSKALNEKFEKEKQNKAAIIVKEVDPFGLADAIDKSVNGAAAETAAAWMAVFDFVDPTGVLGALSNVLNKKYCEETTDKMKRETEGKMDVPAAADLGIMTWVGCFKDDHHRDFRYGPKAYGHTVATCRTEAKQRKMSYFALQHNGWCSIDKEYSTPARYQQVSDNQCGEKCVGETAEEKVFKCGGYARNAVYITEILWIGCFKDDAQRDFRYGPKQYGYTVATCRVAATQGSKKYFALQHGGWCSTDNEYSRHKRYERLTNNKCGVTCAGESAQEAVLKCGGPAANAVYQTSP